MTAGSTSKPQPLVVGKSLPPWLSLLQQRWAGLSDHDQVGVTLAGMGGAIALVGFFFAR